MKQLMSSTTKIGTGKFLDHYNYNKLGGKTGTSEKNKDFWFLGPVTRDIYGLVWLGNNDESTVATIDNIEASSSRFAVPLWGELLRFYANRP
jgi:membrane peptidoglycan carboxypeptidase